MGCSHEREPTTITRRRSFGNDRGRGISLAGGGGDRGEAPFDVSASGSSPETSVSTRDWRLEEGDCGDGL
ncbi:unnamed protein product, partial [Urochloa humidicola]